MENRIVKIQLHGNGDWEIQHEGLSPRGAMEVQSVRSQDLPQAELALAFQALAVHLVSLVDLPKDYAKGLGMVGMQLAWTGEVAQVKLIGEKEIEGLEKPLKLSAPASQFLGVAAGDIARVCSLAMDYVLGDRFTPQTEIEFEETAERAPVRAGNRMNTRRVNNVRGVH